MKVFVGFVRSSSLLRSIERPGWLASLFSTGLELLTTYGIKTIHGFAADEY